MAGPDRRAAADAAPRCRRSRSRPRPRPRRRSAAATSTIDSRLSRSTSTPMWNASASPSTSRSSPRAMNGMATSSAPRNGAMVAALAQVAPLERAQHPERDVAQLPVVGQEHEQPDAGIGQRGDRKPAEQEDRDRGAALARRDAVERERAWRARRRTPRPAEARTAAAWSRRRAAGRRPRWWPRPRARRRSTRRPAPDRRADCGTGPA